MTSLLTPGGLATTAPAERLAALRVLVGGFALVYLLVRLPHLVDVARLADEAPQRFAPVGPLRLLDAPVAPTVAIALLLATLVAGVAAVAGLWWRVSGPSFALGVLLVLSYRNSWGQIFHTENLLVLHLLILAASPAADAWSLDRRCRRHLPVPEPSVRYGWPAQLMVVVVVVAYFLAGWAKVRASGFGWASGDALANLVAHDALRKELVGDRSSPIGVAALRHGWIFPPLATVSLLVELAAPVALLGGRVRLAWVLAAWLFHLGVLVIMGILFPYQLLGVAFACFVAVEAIPRRTRRPDQSPSI